MIGFLISLVFFLGFWIVLTVILWILEIWWPMLPDLQVSQPWHLPILRFFAGYCFHNDLGVFWQIFGVIIVLFGLVLIIARVFVKHRSNQIAMQLVGSLAFVHFLFWVILRNSTKSLEEATFSLDNSFFIYTGILFGGLFFEMGMISLLFLLYTRWKPHHKSTSSANQQKSAVHFSCPHCHAEFNSVVQYCTYCHRNCDEK